MTKGRKNFIDPAHFVASVTAFSIDLLFEVGQNRRLVESLKGVDSRQFCDILSEARGEFW